MAELYIYLKWLHIGAAAVAFGSNVTHLFWIIAANADPMHRANILRLVKKIDDRLAVPAYGLMVACGVTMWLWQWPLGASWLIASLLLTTGLTLLGIGFGPFMQRWIALANAPDRQPACLLVYQRRLTWCWAGMVLAVPLVLYCMVFKPSLW